VKKHRTAGKHFLKFIEKTIMTRELVNCPLSGQKYEYFNLVTVLLATFLQKRYSHHELLTTG